MNAIARSFAFLSLSSCAPAIFIFDLKVKREGGKTIKSRSLPLSASILYWSDGFFSVCSFARSLGSPSTIRFINATREIANSDNSILRTVPTVRRNERVFIIVVDKQLHVCLNNSIAHTCICSAEALVSAFSFPARKRIRRRRTRTDLVCLLICSFLSWRSSDGKVEQ